MEQGQCWMQTTKRKFSLSSNLITSSPTTTHNPSYDDSWEEQAFAEDAAGSLGGCIWPPRSYSCSFCRREFRSAQALGGHMNVHRRDRARLKQPSSPKNEEILFHHHDLENHHLHNPVQNNNPFTSLGSYNLYPSSVCGLAYNKTTNPSSDLDVIASASASSPSPNSKPLLAPPPVNGPLCNSSIVHKTNSSVYSSESWSNLVGDHHQRLYSKKFYPEADFEKVSKGLLDSGCRGKGDDNDSGDADMAVSLNLVVCRAQAPVQFETKEADINCKRRKTDASSIPFLPKSSSVDHRHHVQPQVFELNPSSIEELDLELRLGNRSKENWMEFSPGQGRSYTCTFCKRGFSNAQALGGHMNIHRRDRARLRQSFEENLLSMDSSVKNTTDDQEPQPLEEKALFGVEYSGGDQQKHSSNDEKYKDDHALQRGKAIGTSDQHPNQLPLLVGMPSSINDVRLEGVGEKKNDVDLELRLGLSRKRDQL